MSEEVKPGYKRTEIGVIPEDWDFNSIEFVTPIGGQNGIVDGPFGSNLKTIHYRKTGIPIITSGYVTTGKFEANEYLYVDNKKFDDEKRSAVKAGDIVMAKIGARCGSSAILPHDHPIGILSGNSLKITVDQTRHSTFYIWQVLWSLYSNGRIDELKTVGAQPAISMANLKKYKIPLPQLAEQVAIESVLSDADALVRGLDQLIAKKRDIQQAAMQQLLTGQYRLPGFSGEWKVKPFSHVLKRVNTKSNQVQTSDYQASGKYPIVDQGKDSIVGFSDNEAKRFHNTDDGVIVFGDHTCIVKFVDFDFLIGAEGTQVLHGMEGQSTLFHAFQLQYRGIEPTGYNRHFKFLKARSFQAPPLEEQNAVAVVLSDIESELVALETRRDKARQLKLGMMQELLTGKIRLINQGA